MKNKPTAMKKKIRLLTIILLTCSLIPLLNAQERKGREEHIEKFRSMKIAFITERLELTTEEAEQFWPLYNEYEQTKREISRKGHLRPRNMDERLGDMTEREAEEKINEMMEARKKETELAEAFQEDLKGILPPKKILKLYIVEIQFREYMLRKIRDERHGRQGGMGKNTPPMSPLP
jgi:hypothetical protein